MKKIFTVTVEYPNNDAIPSSEVIEAAQEGIEQYMEQHFSANIMDGDYKRMKVCLKEVGDGKPTKEQVIHMLLVQNAIYDMEQSMDKKYHSPKVVGFINEHYEKFFNDYADKILKYWDD